MTKKIEGFFGPHRFLSNFWMVPIQFENITFPSVEHAYQAAKSESQEDWQRILRCETPGAAKKIGKTFTMRPDFEAKKVVCMAALIEIKFRNPDMRKQLLATGDAELIEANTWGDRFWGTCYGSGQNMLGKILMQERAQILEAMELGIEGR